jgi:hypothetical protein
MSILLLFLASKGGSAFSAFFFDDGVRRGDMADVIDGPEHLSPHRHRHLSDTFSKMALRARLMWSGTDWRAG